MANEKQKAAAGEAVEGPPDFREMLRLRDEANKPGASPRALAALREHFDKHHGLAENIGALSLAAEAMLLEKCVEGGGLREVCRRELQGVRDRLGYKGAGEMERLLIAQICLAWARLQWTEYHVSRNTMGSGVSMPVMMFWEKRLLIAQKRFTHVLESLARVRKLLERKSTAKAGLALIEAGMRDAAVRGLRQAQYDAAGRALAGRFGAQG